MKRFLLPALLLPGAAFAHPGYVGESTLTSGLLHPVAGFDHILAMVVVGIWAAMVGGRLLWAMPLGFGAGMVVGGLAGMLGIPLPGVEPMILASVICLGVAAALSLRPSTTQALGLVGIFGAFHGFAHGAEAPEGDLALYAIGFLLTTFALHLAGIALTMGLRRLGQGGVPRVLAGMVACGGVLLAVGG